ncbi:MAG: lipopolysaccharide transport periplasmic protein LptA [Pseudomonadota bacterium]|nr:lipopolysaccharide transport periplasmic protein LptA [Pseudomonadota bacterium]HJO36658.1 lipopolysaccharide transport periplasmic protein LptA [Gammaproteobacteria bacterium]
MRSSLLPWRRPWVAPLAAVAAAVALAAQAATPAPVTIRADSAVLDEGNLTSRYIGNVEIEQGNARISGEEMRIEHDAEGAPRRLIVTGAPARFRQSEPPPVTGRSQRIEVDLAGNEIRLLGQAEVVRNGDTLRGERIRYQRDSQRILADGEAGGGRIEITITPERTDP